MKNLRSTIAVILLAVLAAVAVASRPADPSRTASTGIDQNSAANLLPPAAAGPTPRPGESNPGSTEKPAPSPGSDQPRLPVCGIYVSEDLRLASFETVDGLSSNSDAVITATVVAVSEGKWATPDGKFAGSDKDFGLLPEVYRVATVSVIAVGKGASDARLDSGRILNVRILGGTVDCRTYRSSSELPFASGDDVVLFLGRQGVLDGAPVQDFDVIDLWPIKDGVVEGRQGDQSPDSVLELSMSK
jgi:hypothetical protein